jgi:putative transposase
VLAAHRGTADAAGINWESAVFRKVKEEVRADRGLTVERMVELARVSRAITQELRRRGWTVNPKRVHRLMREDNLLCVRKRKFVVTTDSHHGRKIYPNLARHMVLTDIDQLWVADITYIRLQEEFVFLAVILDAYSRRVIGWALDRTIEDDLTLSALRMALSQRKIEPGLVHHSDRGSQYASGDYTDLLKDNGIEINMSRKENV